MFGLSPALLKVLKKLGDFLQAAIERAMLDVAQDVRPSPEKMTDWLENEMVDWEPTIKGRKLADPVTRRAAARFLAGVACNFANPQT